MLERSGVPVVGEKFSQTSKAQMVEKLAALIEKGRRRGARTLISKTFEEFAKAALSDPLVQACSSSG
jgi:hypothetical protein